MLARTVAPLLIFAVVGISSQSLQAQETEAATRQYAVAVGFQNQKLFDAAVEEWQTFLRKFPNDPRGDRANHYLGTCCLQEKQYDDAIKALNVVVTKYPNFELMEQSLLNLGIASYGKAQQSEQKSDYARGEKILGQMLAKFPNSQYAPRALYYRGECLYQSDQTEKAAEAYQEFVQKYANHELAADAIYALGTTHEALKQPQQALAAYNIFSSKFSRHELLTEVNMRRAEMLFNTGRYDRAEPIFASISQERDFELADVAMLRHARCLYEKGDNDGAAKLYWNVPREFKNTKHYDAAILAGAKCYFLEEKYTLARTGLSQLSKRDVPEAAEATKWLAQSYLKEGNAQEALRTAEQGMRRHRRSEFAADLELVRVDAMYEMPGQKRDTPDLYADFARRNKRHELAAQAQYMAALASLDIKQHGDAKKHCDEFLTSFGRSPLKPDVLFIAAESRLLLGEYESAVEQYRAFLNVGEDHANATQARVRLGLALHMAEDHQQATRWLTTVVASVTDSDLKSEAYSIMGRSHVALEQYPDAATNLNKAIQAAPRRSQNDETHLALSQAYRELGRNREADSQLQTLLTSFPNSRLASEASFRIAEAAYRNEKFQDALTGYEAVVNKHGDSEFAPHAQYGLGWTLFNLGEYEKSADAMSRLIQRYRTSDPAKKGLYVRAMAAYQLGNYTAVLSDVDSFVATKPEKNDLLDAQYVKGLAQAGLKKFTDAAETYQAILTSANGYPAADKVAYELGWTFVELGRTNEAVAAFGKLATSYPDSPLAAEGQFRVAESYYDAGQYVEAADAYQEASSKGNGEIREKAMHKLGWSLLKSDDFAGARVAFTDQLKKHPNGELSGDARFLIGECSFKQEEWQAAQAAFNQVVRANDSNYVALASFRIGECAASLEDWSNSRQWHQKVLDTYPDFDMKPEARYGLAWALQNEGQYDTAMTLYEQVTDETNTETAAKARFMMGECCFAQKKHKDATKHFLKTAFLYNHEEWSAMAYFEAARCFEVLQDIEQATSCYNNLITKYPQHSKVRDARRRLNELN